MKMNWLTCGVSVLMLFGSAAIAQDDLPRVLDDRLKIELIAENPDLVTPTGIDVDHRGRVFVIESNTHFPPDGYKGHPTDRVLVIDNPSDPKKKKINVFADGLKHAMSVAVKPLWVEGSGLRVEGQKENGPGTSSSNPQPSTLNTQLFIATRNEILLLTDTDGDLKADEKQRLVFLDTAGNYPHNALAGFAFDALGNMFFGLGENMANDYKLIGSDGTTLSGIEAGKLYRCKPDGSKLEQWATGFWNPHASCFDAFGRLFTVDNDPDSRPPCRLLHVIPGGDYGYRFRNGRKGTHPFTSWNGEIPGTLPMVAGTGEAPSGIVCYENDGFPEDYLGTLLVGSWGDHRIDQFVLEPKGASFTSKAKPIIKGGENFRPVGLAVAPDGSLYFSDWVLKDYKLHGKGRVWRVSGKVEPKRAVIDVATMTAANSEAELSNWLGSPRLDVRRMAVRKAINARKPWEWFQKIRNPNENLRSVCEINIFDPDLKDADDRFARSLQNFSCDDRWRKLAELYRPMQFDAFGRTKLFGYLNAGDVPQEWNLKVLTGKRDNRLSTATKGINQDTIDVVLMLTARRNYSHAISIPSAALRTSRPIVRFLAVQWVGEEMLTELRPDVEALLADPTTTPDLFLACLATLQLLDGKPASEFEKNPPTQYIAAMVTDAKRPATLRATALRMLPANAAELTAPLLTELLSSTDDTLRIETVRTLAGSPLPEARGLLLPIAAHPQAAVEIRAEAIAGLCNGMHEKPLAADVETFLLKTARGNIDVDLSDASQKRSAVELLQLEALRSLRGRAGEKTKIRAAVEKAGETASEDSALSEAIAIVLTGKSNADPQPTTIGPQPSDNAVAGRRVFYSHNGPLCAKCHTVQGRGGQVGPDLTVIARTMDREKLLASMLEPSKEISPQFTTWVIETTSGKTHTGFIVEDNRSGQIKLGTPTGETVVINEDEIETREPSKTSVMPEKLHERMTTQELRDLLAFLATLK